MMAKMAHRALGLLPPPICSPPRLCLFLPADANKSWASDNENETVWIDLLFRLLMMDLMPFEGFD